MRAEAVTTAPIQMAAVDSAKPASTNMKQSFMALKMKAKQNNMNENETKLEMASQFTHSQMQQTQLNHNT